MQVEIKIINAFTKEDKGGNPAAVVLEGDRFSAEQKQAIAAKIGLSETAFVGTSTEADYKMDFFTPVRQIAHCGHATIATFSYLKQAERIIGNVSSKMTTDGRRAIRFTGNEAYMEQKAPQFYPLNEETRLAILQASGLQTEAIATLSSIIVNTGNSFAIIEVQHEETLQNLIPQFDAIAAISEEYGLIGFYLFCKPAAATLDATTRMFAPAYGIEEEAATGMAAGPLACYLHQFGERKESYRIEQGRFMKAPSPSLLKVDLVLKEEDIIGLYAGGSAILMDTQMVEI